MARPSASQATSARPADRSGETGGRARAARPANGRRNQPRTRRINRIRRLGLPYLLLLPALLFELLIHLVPMIVGVFISFKALTQLYLVNWQGAPWAGLANYRIVTDFTGPAGQALLHSFVVTCAYTALAVGFSWLLGFAAAVLAQDRFPGRGLLRAVFLTPYALPVYASVITWAFMFQYDNGLLNHVLHDELGLTSKPTFWLLGDNSFFALVIVAVWRNWPFAFLVIMAGLQAIPRDFYEASAIDGAGVWKQIRYVTLPSLRSINQVLVLVLFLWTFNDFTTPYVLFGNAAPQPADVISVHIYQSSFLTWNFGEGSAMSVLLLLFLLLVTGSYLMLTRRRRQYA